MILPPETDDYGIWQDEAPPANRALVALGCLSGAIVLALGAALAGWL